MNKLALFAAFAAGLVFAAPAFGDELVEAGQKIYGKCLACHSNKDMANRVGPSLLGIVGRPVATAAGFKYSEAMLDFAKTAGSWDDAKLDAYLADPKKDVPKNKMPFVGLPKPEDRAAVIAYLKTLVAP